MKTLGASLYSVEVLTWFSFLLSDPEVSCCPAAWMLWKVVKTPSRDDHHVCSLRPHPPPPPRALGKLDKSCCSFLYFFFFFTFNMSLIVQTASISNWAKYKIYLGMCWLFGYFSTVSFQSYWLLFHSTLQLVQNLNIQIKLVMETAPLG